MNVYDRSGAPITFERYAELSKDFDSYKRVLLHEIGESKISTVWLGINYNFSGEGLPIIFETMIFGGSHDNDQWRWETEDEAKRQHVRIAAALSEGVCPHTSVAPLGCWHEDCLDTHAFRNLLEL